MPSDQKTKIPAVPVKTPMFDESGNLTRTWIIFFERIFEGTNSRVVNNTDNTGAPSVGAQERFVFGIALINEMAVENNVTPKITVERTECELLRWRITAIDGPVGAAIWIDIKRNGVTLFPAGGANKIVLAAGAVRNQGTVFKTANLKLVLGDELTCEVLQVGSTTPGFRIEVQLVAKVTK